MSDAGGPTLRKPDAELERHPSPVHLPLSRELARKSIHIASAVIPLAYAGGLDKRWLLGALGVLALVAIAIEVVRARSARARAAFTGAVGGLLREHELGAWSGATWMAIAYALAVLLFARPVAVAAMLGVAFGDSAAAVVGRTLGRHRLPWMPHKSLEGSVACALVTFASALLIARLDLGASVIAGMAAAAGEMPRHPFDDNIRIVAAVGGAVTLWMMW